MPIRCSHLRAIHINNNNVHDKIHTQDLESDMRDSDFNCYHYFYLVNLLLFLTITYINFLQLIKQIKRKFSSLSVVSFLPLFQGLISIWERDVSYCEYLLIFWTCLRR